MIQVTAGRLNKQIAGDIGITESPVKVHRANLMRKMKARSPPELSRMADALNAGITEALRHSEQPFRHRAVSDQPSSRQGSVSAHFRSALYPLRTCLRDVFVCRAY